MGDSSEMESMQTFRDFMANYNKLSEICFADCIWDFTNRKVSNAENTCALNCAEKYLKMNQRISTRFQEFQVLSNENTLAQISKMK
jgi:import inner membrane translocase subunit TIM9